jgi:hypothetical protein
LPSTTQASAAIRLSHAADEFLGIVSGQIAPSRLPVDRVELDVPQLQQSRDFARQCGLPGARCTDHHDPHQPLGLAFTNTVLRQKPEAKPEPTV